MIRPGDRLPPDPRMTGFIEPVVDPSIAERLKTGSPLTQPEFRELERVIEKKISELKSSFTFRTTSFGGVNDADADVDLGWDWPSYVTAAISNEREWEAASIIAERLDDDADKENPGLRVAMGLHPYEDDDDGN